MFAPELPKRCLEPWFLGDLPIAIENKLGTLLFLLGVIQAQEKGLLSPTPSRIALPEATETRYFSFLNDPLSPPLVYLKKSHQRRNIAHSFQHEVGAG